MDITQTIVLGVVSGILTTFLLFVLSRFVTHWLIPRYQEWRYQGADVNGTWVADYTEVAPERSTNKALTGQSTNRTGMPI